MPSHPTERTRSGSTVGTRYLCDAELWVDPETWQRAVALVKEASGLLHDHVRPPRSDGTVHVNAQLAMFQMLETLEGGER